MFLSSVCSQGSCNHGDKCCYSHDPERTKEEKMEWFHQLFYFFFKYFYLWTLTGRVQPGWSENDAAVRLHFNGNKNPDSCWLTEHYSVLSQSCCFFVCFSPIKSSRRRYSHCFGRHLTCQAVSFGMFIISFWNTQDELLRTAFKMYNSKHLS